MDDFFESLATADSSVLGLDYDGTLAPFVTDRQRAFPYPGVRSRLAAIQAADGRIVIISGRPADDIPPLLGLNPSPEIWGSHGWERRLPDGSLHPVVLPATTAEILNNAWQAVESRGLVARAERKVASIAVHWRGLERTAAAAISDDLQAAWRPLTSGSEVALLPFAQGLELRACGRNKGDAVRAVLATAPDGAVIAYLGDDVTDEDAFRELGDAGLAVLVSDEPRTTAASLWLRPPAELLAFLDRWLEAISGPPNSPRGD